MGINPILLKVTVRIKCSVCGNSERESLLSQVELGSSSSCGLVWWNGMDGLSLW
jgi:hypothetical protein